MAKKRYTYLEDKQLYRKRIKTSDGKYKDIYARTQDELDDKLYSIDTAKRAGIRIDDKTTVAELAAEWYRLRVKNTVAPSTLERMRCDINKTILPVLGDKRVVTVSVLDIDKMMGDMAAAKAKSTNAKTLNIIRRIFNYAVELSMISDNPAQKCKAGGKRPRKIKPLTREQQKTLLDAVKGNRIHLFVALCLYTGVRCGEALALKWDCVHLDEQAPYINVVRNLSFVTRTNAVLSDYLKSASARRQIPLPGAILQLLAEHKKQSNSDFVFCRANGQHLRWTDFCNWWAYILRRMDRPSKWTNNDKPLDFALTPHILRHTYITELIASGMDVKKVQYLAGHATIQMTLNVYADVIDNRPEDLISSITAIWG